MRLGLSLSKKKKNEWKCCIKPLIRVEHIRIILRAQSGSCYAAACVVLLATEFSPLIGVHASVWMHWERLACAAVFDVVCVCGRESWFEESLRCVCSSRCKAGRPKRHQVPWLKIQMGLPLPPSPSLPSVSLDAALSQPEVFSFPAQLSSLNDSQLRL